MGYEYMPDHYWSIKRDIPVRIHEKKASRCYFIVICKGSFDRNFMLFGCDKHFSKLQNGNE